MSSLGMCIYTVFLVAQMVKNLPAMQETQVQSLGQEDPQRRRWQPTPVFLSGESHGQRSPKGHSPWGRKEADTTEQLHFLSFFPLNLGLLFESEYMPIQKKYLY